MKQQGRRIMILRTAIVLGLAALGGISTGLQPVTAAAPQQSPQEIYAAINLKAKENKAPRPSATPEELADSFAKSAELARLVIAAFSVFEMPEDLQTNITDQVANASLNGSSDLDDNNIVAAVKTLADDSAAPDYAYTNVEQVGVVRTFLNRLIPEVVPANGPMTDMAAFAVFLAAISQKTDNDAFMVTPAEFSASLAASTNEPPPGSRASNALNVPEAVKESAKANQMLQVIEAYVGVKDRLSSNDIIAAIGLH